MRLLCGVPESTPGAAWVLMVPGGAGVTAGTLWLTPVADGILRTGHQNTACGPLSLTAPSHIRN